MGITRNRRPFPVADRRRDGELFLAYHPRLDAIRWLRDKIANGHAGLDPYDETIFILDVGQHETVRGHRSFDLVGVVLSMVERIDGGRRYRGVVEADVRAELGLDRPDAPTIDDEPLASRKVNFLELAAAEAGGAEALRLLDEPKTPVMRAIADARDAQQRMLERRVH